MKKIILLALAIGGICTSLDVEAQNRNRNQNEERINFPKQDVSPMDVILFRNENKDPVMRVLYSRPHKRDREVFGKLVPYGKVWRTGANEATEVSLYTDMMVGDKVVQAGTYTLYTIPEENEWTVILNKSTNVWGSYDYHQEDDVVRIQAPVRMTSAPVESLSMTFEPMENGTNLLIGWDDRYVKIPFKEAP